MKQEELENYNSLTAFQKQIVDTLKEMGFEHMHYKIWCRKGYGNVNMNYIETLQQLIGHFHHDGKVQKSWEIQRAIGL